MEKERNRQRLGSCRCCCCWFCWWSVKFSVVLFAPAPTLPLFKLVVLCLFFSFAFHRPNVNENADAAACVTSAGKKTSRSSSHSFEVFPLNQLSLLSLSLSFCRSLTLSLLGQPQRSAPARRQVALDSGSRSAKACRQADRSNYRRLRMHIAHC